MQLSSSVFVVDTLIPAKYTCQGDDINPPLTIIGVPPTTASLALIMHDPDAPIAGGFTHWVVYDIPPSLTEIPEKTQAIGTAGVNSAGKTSYSGPCPATGRHHYSFKIYALDTKVDTAGLDKTKLEANMDGHILAQAELVGLYEKT